MSLTSALPPAAWRAVTTPHACAPWYERRVGKRSSRIFVVAGAIGTLVSGWVAGGAAAALLRDPAPPPRVALAVAPDRTYLRLDDAVLDCDTRAVRDRTTLVLGADAAGGHPFVAHLVGEVRCKDIVLEGSFRPGKFTRAFFRERHRVSLPEGEDVRLFTEAPSPRYQKNLLTRTVPWLAFAILLLALGIRGLRTP